MANPLTLLLLSDIHFASDAEKARGRFEARAVDQFALRLALRAYRRYLWCRDPFAHNQLLDRVLAYELPVDWAIANGDYSCDSAFIGVSDAAACQSARQCLDKLRGRFPGNFRATIGDHELGKRSMLGGKGGLRLGSWQTSIGELGLEPFWKLEIGRYVLVGITSSLVALPVFEPEGLPDEIPQWRALRRQHLDVIAKNFSEIAAGRRILLFCHDPSALPFLWQLEALRDRLHQLERTIIGHLHTPLVLWQSRWLAGLPPLRRFGHAARRMSQALNQAKLWKPFRILLCPALAGCELLKDGGYYVARIDPDAKENAEFQLQRLER